MSIPVESLTEADYKIMTYVSEYPFVTRENVIEHFRGKLVAVSLRIDVLSRSTPKYGSKDEKAIEAFSRYIDNNSGALSITEFGAAALQEHKFRKRAHIIDIIVNRIWVPIAVSIVTAAITAVITWLITDWLSR